MEDDKNASIQDSIILADQNPLGLKGPPFVELMTLLEGIENADDSCDFEGFTQEDVEYARIMGMKMVCSCI